MMKNKIVFGVFLVIVTVLGLAIYIICECKEKEQNKLITLLSESNSKALTNNYKYAISSYEKLLNTVAENVSSPLAGDKFEANASFLISSAYSLKNRYNILDVAIISDDGVVYSSDEMVLDWNAKALRRPYFVEVVEKGGPFYQSKLYKSVHTGKMVLTLAVPVHFNEDVVGMVLFDISGTSLLSDVEREFVLTDEHGIVFAVDPVNARWLNRDIYEIRSQYRGLSATDKEPLIYQNEFSENFAVTKSRLFDGNYLFTIIPLDNMLSKQYLKSVCVFFFVFFAVFIGFSTLFYAIKNKYATN
ncbi:PDC sensor domain-containing protein [Vibrio campbellii]|uniref:PDC sensor domain-containing protein n=1 Tax=Vibrio campbellii TaxID=680 RepID=UPI00373628FA